MNNASYIEYEKLSTQGRDSCISDTFGSDYYTSHFIRGVIQRDNLAARK